MSNPYAKAYAESFARLRDEMLASSRKPNTATREERDEAYREEPRERDDDDRQNRYSEREMIG